MSIDVLMLGKRLILKVIIMQHHKGL